MPIIKLNNHNLNYNITGKGVPLILINGLGHDSLAWGNIPETLAEKYKVITMDNYGCGQSDHPDSDIIIKDMANDVMALMDELMIDKASIFGQSMGGAIVQTVAADHPNRIHKLILCDAFAKLNFISQLVIETMIEVQLQKVDIDTVIKMIFTWGHSASFLQTDKNAERLVEMIKSHPSPQPLDSFTAQSKALFEFDSREWLEKIECPTLIIAAVEDLLVLPDEADYLQKNIKDSELKVIPGGHASHIEYPELIIELVEGFLG